MNGSQALEAGSTNCVDVKKSTSVANNMVTGLGSVSFGGTLVISNLGSALAAGDAIPLYVATNYSGNFSQIIPAAPGAGLAWSTSALDTTGTLQVVTGVNLSPTNIIGQAEGGQLMLSWPADHTGWQLQVQPNSVGIGTDWVDVTGSGATNQMSIPIATNGSVYYCMVYP